jgi:hypothetical protein
MKNILTILFVLISVSFSNAQSSMFVESGVSSLGSNNHIGYEYINKDSRFGFYVTVGGNSIDRLVGLNHELLLDVKGDFTSTVSWYTKNGSYYETMPPTEVFTSSQWGNSLLETGNCVNTVETWDGEQTSKIKIYNVGVVINGSKNFKYRVGLGVRNLKQTGQCEYNYWRHSFSVSKYYDEWGVVAQPNGIFVVENSGSVSEWKENKTISVDKTEINMNFAIEYEMSNKTIISLGYNTKGGVNFGIGFSMK